MSPCIGLGVPMIPLTSQERMNVFLKENNLSEFNINVFDENLSQKLILKIEEFLKKPEFIKEKFLEARVNMRSKTLDFNKKVENHIASYIT